MSSNFYVMFFEMRANRIYPRSSNHIGLFANSFGIYRVLEYATKYSIEYPFSENPAWHSPTGSRVYFRRFMVATRHIVLIWFLFD